MMANDQDKNPTAGQESDISKSQATQQPTDQQGRQAETDEDKSSDRPDEGLQGETATKQQTDVEGSSQAESDSNKSSGGFVGSQGQQDSSSELVDEDDKDVAKGGQDAPEDK